MNLEQVAKRNRASAEGALWTPLEWPVDTHGEVRKQSPEEAATGLARRLLAILDFALTEGLDLSAAVEQQLQAQEDLKNLAGQ